MNPHYPPALAALFAQPSPDLREMILGPIDGPMRALARRLASPFHPLSKAAIVAAKLKERRIA